MNIYIYIYIYIILKAYFLTNKVGVDQLITNNFARLKRRTRSEIPQINFAMPHESTNTKDRPVHKCKR